MKSIKLYFALCFLISVSINAQSFTGGFNFLMPGRDTASTKFIPKFPARPIGSNEYVSINSDGNFQVLGNPIKFWGVNLVGGGAFNDKANSWFIAGRMRKIGINLVRFHHLDNPWNSESIFYFGQSTRILNPYTLDKLDYMLAKLKENGIYANMNLNVSRTFRTSDGVQGADSIVDFAKGVTIFDPQLIALQQEYASQLLGHINPYTGISYANDPVIGMIEIINENSLYRMWRENRTKSFSQGGSLIIRHVKMLDSLWNNFLVQKYSNTQNLASAWNIGTIPMGTENLIRNGDFETLPISTNWQMELHNGAVATFAADVVNPYAGIISGKVSVTTVTGTSWHIQFKQVGFSIKKDTSYSVSFAARAETNRNIYISMMRDNAPYTYYTGQMISVSPIWKVFTLNFKAPEDNNGQTRISFEFENTIGNFWFDNVQIMRTGVEGLQLNENLENRSVKRTDFNLSGGISDPRVKDMSSFYIGLQNTFFQNMKDYLKNYLMVKAPIVGTNWNIGPGDLTSQSIMDYTDNHAYWDHPQFPGTPWSSTDWLINNTPMVKSSSGGTIPATFGGVAFYKKPFTVSEYNHPFPNRYQSETSLFLAAYSSFHDVDGLMVFDYSGNSTDYELDKITGYFETQRNPVFTAMFPSCAYAYRNSLIKKANQTVLLDYNAQDILMAPKNDGGAWEGWTIYNRLIGLQHAVRNRSFDAASTTNTSLLPIPTNPFKTDTDEIIYNTNGLLSIATPAFIGAAGFLNNFIDTKISKLQIKSANDFASLTWLSLSGDSLHKSPLSLITLASRLQNTGMIWDGTNTIHNNWGNAPTENFPLDVSLDLNIFADSIKVYPLAADGKEKLNLVKRYYPTSTNHFVVQFNQSNDQTLWYGIEKFGSGAPNSIDQDKTNLIKGYKLEQNYPNPFNGATLYKYSIARETKLQIEIFDILGRKIKTLFDGISKEGNYSAIWDGKDDLNQTIVSGVYLVKMKSDNYLETIKSIYLK